MNLEVQVKRQKVDEVEKISFDLEFPSFDTKTLNESRIFALEIDTGTYRGKLMHPVLAEVEMRPQDLKTQAQVGDVNR